MLGKSQHPASLLRPSGFTAGTRLWIEIDSSQTKRGIHLRYPSKLQFETEFHPISLWDQSHIKDEKLWLDMPELVDEYDIRSHWKLTIKHLGVSLNCPGLPGQKFRCCSSFTLDHFYTRTSGAMFLTVEIRYWPISALFKHGNNFYTNTALIVNRSIFFWNIDQCQEIHNHFLDRYIQPTLSTCIKHWMFTCWQFSL